MDTYIPGIYIVGDGIWPHPFGKWRRKISLQVTCGRSNPVKFCCWAFWKFTREERGNTIVKKKRQIRFGSGRAVKETRKHSLRWRRRYWCWYELSWKNTTVNPMLKAGKAYQNSYSLPIGRFHCLQRLINFAFNWKHEWRNTRRGMHHRTYLFNFSM